MSPPPVELYRYRGYVAHWYDKSTSYHAAFGQGHLATWGMSFLEKLLQKFLGVTFWRFPVFFGAKASLCFCDTKKQKEGGVYGRLERSYTIQIYPNISHPNISQPQNQYIPSNFGISESMWLSFWSWVTKIEKCLQRVPFYMICTASFFFW